MLETSARLLRLLSLFQRRRYWAGTALAGELGITARTLRRDVDKLRSLGYPIHSSSGAEGGYQMGAGADMPPLLLDDDEAVAVFVGLQQIAGVGEAPVRALAKMEQILPPRLAKRVAALRAVVVTSGRGEVAVDARTLTLLAGACRDLESLRFRYSDYGGKVSARRVEPHRMVATKGLWYLVGWDLDRDAWRTYRVDRIEGRPVAGERFSARPLPSGDLASFVSDGYWRSLEKCRARVRVMVPAEEAARRYPGGVFEAIDSESCYWEAAATSWEKLAMHFGWMGVDFLVDGPVELIEGLRQMEQRYRNALKHAY